MLGRLMYVALEANAFHNPEALMSERYQGNKFVALDIKEVENEYMAVFIDNLGNFDVKPINKVKFLGFMDAKDVQAITLQPFMQEIDAHVPDGVLTTTPSATIKIKGKRNAAA